MQFPYQEADALRVGIISRSGKQRTCLQQILEENGLHVVADQELLKNIRQPDCSPVDVLLINLDESDDQGEMSLDSLVEQVELPILFNDSATIRTADTVSGKAWGRRLAGKLIELVANASAQTRDSVTQATEESTVACAEVTAVPMDVVAGTEHEVINLEVAELLEGNKQGLKVCPSAEFDMASVSQEGQAKLNNALRIVALGASIGGPEALKRFLSVIPENFPVAFVLAQHIGLGFVDLLAEQLGRVCKLEVKSAGRGEILSGGQLMIAPVEFRMTFDDAGTVLFDETSEHSIYSPSIDNLMSEVAGCYGAMANAIVFSGMGNDGLKGCRDIVNAGGSVWAQSPDSCVISSMADAVRDEGIVDFSGTPEQLGEHLVRYIDGLRI